MDTDDRYRNLPGYFKGCEAFRVWIRSPGNFPPPNPYQEGTDDYRAWNVGWNDSSLGYEELYGPS